MDPYRRVVVSPQVLASQHGLCIRWHRRSVHSDCHEVCWIGGTYALDAVSHSACLTFDVILQRNEWMNDVLVFLVSYCGIFSFSCVWSWMNQRIVYVCVFLPCDLSDWVKAILRSYTWLGPKSEFRNSGWTWIFRFYRWAEFGAEIVWLNWWLSSI